MKSYSRLQTADRPAVLKDPEKNSLTTGWEGVKSSSSGPSGRGGAPIGG